MQPYQELESKFASQFHLDQTVACCTGTAALHLALESLHLPLGSKAVSYTHLTLPTNSRV